MRYADITPPVPDGSPPGTRATPYILGDDMAGRGAGSKWITELEIDLTQETLDAKPLEAAFVSRKGLKNYAVTIRVTTEHEFANANECFKFKVELPLNMPSGGKMKINTTSGQQIFFDNAVIQNAQVKDIGEVAAAVSYTILAGKPSLT